MDGGINKHGKYVLESGLKGLREFYLIWSKILFSLGAQTTLNLCAYLSQYCEALDLKFSKNISCNNLQLCSPNQSSMPKKFYGIVALKS